MSRKNSVGSTRTNSTISVSSTQSITTMPKLHPCSASSQLVLYAQGSSVLCLQHDTLALERRFERHAEEVTVISIDNASDITPARVVSVDKSKTAIVWDIETGEEISRHNAYEDILVASWMKNGNLALGDALGNIILFDPARAESITARTIFDPLCSIAPTADCRAFALGYNNGSILIAALSPAFTILHTLTITSLAPSPVVSLAWHASSSKQKSDMLAVQNRDGDLRVWSVPKSLESEENARVVRILKRPEYFGRGNNWLGWSRNGRIVQHSAGSTTIWDVRTKNVTWDDVPTADIMGICIYGSKGVLFTVGRNHTVQQFALYPPQLVANVQHAPVLPPPSPPVSIEERIDEVARGAAPQEDYMMPQMGHLPHELEQVESMEYIDGGLGISNVMGQRPASVSSRSSVGSTGSRRNHSSQGSLRGLVAQGSEYSPATTVSPNPGRKGPTGSSIGTVPQLVQRKTHPLRQEYHPTPNTPGLPGSIPSPMAEVTDIFANLRARINSVTYESPRVGGPQSRLSEDDLRKEMLYCIFGWQGDIEDLIGDELESVNARSLDSLVLRLWLGDIDQNSLAVMLGADFAVSGDWLFLALSAMGGQSSWTHVVRAFVLKLLQKGDLHMAVLCLLAIGDKNDAVEIYVSHKKFLYVHHT
ncbi:WD40-repeat-containing domain protein [Sphaerosporella brunnea]|uniref:WD40-repeat-containing domain protein n=1 Tax=Sphaerosporella brunnea TaxID=1250544 RepID=A0A5J5ER15_9PEZI|nr:WD40-repeat-containing domain protein [Sphaerosporella brunnea]